MAPRIGETHVEIAGVAEDVRLAATRLVRAINVLGLPAISVPLDNEGGYPSVFRSSGNRSKKYRLASSLGL